MGDTNHYVYAIGAFSSELDVAAIKIGVTSGSVEWRRRSLATGSHLPLWTLGFKRFAQRKRAADFESECHQSLELYRMRGEWFAPVRQVVQFIVEHRMGWMWSVDDFDARCMQFCADTESPHYPGDGPGDWRCPLGCEMRSWRGIGCSESDFDVPPNQKLIVGEIDYRSAEF